MSDGGQVAASCCLVGAPKCGRGREERKGREGMRNEGRATIPLKTVVKKSFHQFFT
jgi:hypothetical protein